MGCVTVNLGYACINLTLGAQGITSTRGMIQRTFEAKGIQYASLLSLQNAMDLLKITEWNVANNINVFRITSEMFPWSSAYKFEQLPDYKEIRAVLEQVGKHPVRFTSHPSPFNKLAGEGNTLVNTIDTLEKHSLIFDMMGLPATHRHKINIHVGGAYGDKTKTLETFAKNYKKLSKNLRGRLTVENDDKLGLYAVNELMPLHETIGIPIVFDYFHHKLHPNGLDEEDAFNLCYNTWNVTPLFHFSSSRRDHEDPLAKREAHSDWVHGDITT
ncbi:MAG TPA: UV DNA damage repair endonuclease UvsE, partial [Chitinophagales bacterium]|nr:UV DNA damage repair endonuclease UvsE [Chitinophagales bacterium]